MVIRRQFLLSRTNGSVYISNADCNSTPLNEEDVGNNPFALCKRMCRKVKNFVKFFMWPKIMTSGTYSIFESSKHSVVKILTERLIYTVCFHVVPYKIVNKMMIFQVCKNWNFQYLLLKQSNLHFSYLKIRNIYLYLQLYY